ncbi:hypothetical protein Tco_1016099 [Tanacetum coccineum]|uniref:DUF4283 domain-containing protein n=1 Tax=Tanacetum coccineum TaxID=301880 RepID=A0ABQ5FN53_9ASTR
MSENEDRYYDTILDLEAKLKKNVDLILKLGNSLQGILSKSEIPLNVRDTKDTLDDASKSQQKMKEKMNDPIAVANKQNCWTIDYKQINALYKNFVPQKELFDEQKYFPSSFIPSDKTPNATSFVPASMPNQVKPIVNELQFYFEFLRKLFQRDIKEMKYVFESTESELCEIKKQNDFLKDQLLEASLRHEVEISVLLNHECVDNSLHAEIEQIKKNSIEIQEGLQAKIKILEKDVQRCQKQSVDFELKLQHEKEKHKWESTLNNKNTNPLDYSWISKMEKLENENVSLEFQVQSLIKERDNVKLEYQKLFDSIKKTRSQSQKEMDELIEHVSEKTYAYGAIRAENQNLLSTISELKTRLETVEKGVVAVVNRTKVIKSPSSLRNSFRFIKNPDQANLLEDLNKIWIGSHHLFASIARFDRKQNSQPNQSHQKQSNNTKPHETGHASHTTGGRSYASVLNGKEGTQKPVLAGPITKNITLENSDLLELSDTSSVVLAKCKYMGGLWLWIEFSSDESRLKFQKNTEMELYFTQRKLVSHNFIPDERMIWIEIDGLPLNAWTTNAFKKIAGNWGETVFVDEDADENIANGRVRVREFANWVPDFASLDNISQHDYESEASGNDQDIHSINESQEEGEINDKKEQMGYEMNAPDCSNNVTEKCGVVNNNMSNNVEGEILEDHFDGDCGNDTIDR